jgi:hypothetical protein
MNVRNGLTARLGVALLLAVCASAQTTDSEALPQARDRAAVPPPEANWKKSPVVEAPYVPLSLKDKTYLFGWRTLQPSSFAKSAFTAAIAQWQDTPAEWGQGMEGYGRRYGHRLANRGVESAIGLGVTAALRQDPRYYRNPGAGAGKRLWNALSQVVITRTDGGGKTFSVWRFAGNYGGQFVSNTWRPERQRTFGNTMERGSISLSFDVASNVFKEFWPDIKRRVFKK